MFKLLLYYVLKRGKNQGIFSEKVFIDLLRKSLTISLWPKRL